MFMRRWLGRTVLGATFVGCWLPSQTLSALDTVLSEDFQSYAPGTLGSPWSISQAGTSQASVVASGKRGQGLFLHGGLESDFLVASRARLINGMPTACIGAETGLSPPFTDVNVMDASIEGWGGDVRFDHIKVTATR